MQVSIGKPLALKFAGDFLPAHEGKIQDMFHRPGAYVRFKELLAQCEILEQWHEYEDQAGREALREWCAENGIEIDG